MKKTGRDVEQIYDIIAFRVITDSVRDCYAVLGVVHSNWTPVPGRFKDFIALPKPNLYQSLHTTVIGPRAERMEVQIRTQEMHRIAEQGIAAHWKYKEQKSPAAEDGKAFAWLRQLMEWQRDLKDPTEFIETVKIDLFQDEVFVFTPKGDVKALPKGATPIDLAYAIHSKVGEHCSGARVNGLIVPLRYALRNGDTVEILASANQKPSKDWLKFVVTSRAKTKIRHYIRMEQRERSRQMGRDLLARELRKQDYALATAEREGLLDTAAQRLRVGTADDLLVAVGYGKMSPTHAADAVLADRAAANGTAVPVAPVPEVPSARAPDRPQALDRRHPGPGRGGHPGEVRQVLHPGPGRLHHRVHQPRPRRGHPHPRLPEGAGPGPGPAGRRQLGRRVEDAAPGGGPGHLRGPPGAAGGHLEVVHRARGQHLPGQVPHHRGRPGREHLPGHGRPRRPAENGAAEPGDDTRSGLRDPAVIEAGPRWPRTHERPGSAACASTATWARSARRSSRSARLRPPTRCSPYSANQARTSLARIQDSPTKTRLEPPGPELIFGEKYALTEV